MSYESKFSFLDTDSIDFTTLLNDVSADLIVAPTQASVPNALVVIPGQGVYVPQGAGLSVVDTDCIDMSFDPITGVLSSVITLAPAQAGIDNALSCIGGQGLYVPDLCDSTAVYSNTLPIRLQQYNSGGDVCAFFELPVIDITAPPCTDQETLDVALGVRDSTWGWFKTAEQRKTTRSTTTIITLIPTSDFVILVDNTVGAVTVTLDPPADCDPAMYNIKLTTVDVNEVTVTPSSGTIDGNASVTFSSTVGINAKTAMQIFFDGTNWHIL